MKSSFLRQLAIALALILLLVDSTAATIGDLNTSDLDPSFAAGAGRLTVSPTGTDSVFAMAIAPDGKIVTAGNNSAPYNKFEVARFLPDGALDTMFNGTGVGTADFSEPNVLRNSLAYAVLVQSDGKIILGGHTYDQSEHDFGIARFNVTGELDTTFGVDHNGLIRTHFGTDPSSNEVHDNIVYGLGLQPGGKIIATGHVFDGEHIVTGIARYCSNGLLDDGINCGAPGFGVGGKRTLPYTNYAESIYPMAMFPDGRFVLAGHTFTGTPGGDFVLYGLCANGELADGVNCAWNFGGGGRVTTDINTSAEAATALALQRDGKIIAAGWTNSSTGTTNFDYALVRYNPDGSLDTTFNGTGKVYLDVAGNQDSPVAVAVAPDNKILVVGNDRAANTTYSIVRFCANGTLDNGSNCGPAPYGNSGIRMGNGFAPNSGNFATNMVIQKDGRIVVSGIYYNSDGTTEIGLARYMAGSHLSFGGVSVGEPFTLGNTNATIQLAQGGPCDFTIDKDNIFPRGEAVPSVLPIRWQLTSANACTFTGTLTLRYTDQELAAGEVTDAQNLHAYFSEDGVTWVPTAASTANPAENSVTVTGAASSGYWMLRVHYDNAVLMPVILK